MVTAQLGDTSLGAAAWGALTVPGLQCASLRRHARPGAAGRTQASQRAAR